MNFPHHPLSRPRFSKLSVLRYYTLSFLWDLDLKSPLLLSPFFSAIVSNLSHLLPSASVLAICPVVTYTFLVPHRKPYVLRGLFCHRTFCDLADKLKMIVHNGRFMHKFQNEPYRFLGHIGWHL